MLALSVLLIMAGVEQNHRPPRRTPASATQATSSTRQTRLTSSDTGNPSFTQRNEQSPSSETDNENTSLFSMLANIQGQLKQLNENYTSLNTQVNDILNRINTETANNRKANETLQKRLDSMERRVEYLSFAITTK